jgi:hypothetical protein
LRIGKKGSLTEHPSEGIFMYRRIGPRAAVATAIDLDKLEVAGIALPQFPASKEKRE